MSFRSLLYGVDDRTDRHQFDNDTPRSERSDRGPTQRSTTTSTSTPSTAAVPTSGSSSGGHEHRRPSTISLAARRRETKESSIHSTHNAASSSTQSSPSISPVPPSSMATQIGANVSSVLSSFAPSGGPLSIERVRKLESECAELRLKLNDSKKTITLLESSKAELLAAVAVAGDRQRALHDQSSTIIEQFREKALSLKKKTSTQKNELRAEIAARDQSLNNLTMDRNALMAERDQLRQQILDITHARDELAHRSADDHHNRNDLERMVREKESTIVSLTNNVKAQADRIEELTFTQQELSARLRGVAHEAGHIGKGNHARYGSAAADDEGRLVHYHWVVAKLHQYAVTSNDHKRAIEQLIARNRRYIQELRAQAATQQSNDDTITPQVTTDSVCERFEQEVADLASLIGVHGNHQHALEVDRNELETSAQRRTNHRRLRTVQRAIDIGRHCVLRSCLLRWSRSAAIIGAQHAADENHSLRKRYFANQQAAAARLHAVFGRQLLANDQHRVTTVFREWHVVTTTRRTRRAAILRRLVHALTGGLVQAFNTWHDYAKSMTLNTVMAKLRLTQETAHRQAAEGRLAALRCFQANTARLLAVRIFATWRQAATVRKLRYHVFTQAHKQIRSKRLERIIHDHWRHWCDLSRAITKRRAIVDRVARMVVARGYVNTAQRALRQWYIFAEQERWNEERHILHDRIEATKARSATAIVRRWRMGTLVPAFNAWRATARELRDRKHHLLHSTLQRLHNGQLWCAWRIWRLYSEHTAAERLRADLRRHKHSASVAILKRWTLGRATPVFLAWRQAARDMRTRKRTVLETACNRLTNQALWRTWRQWRYYIEQSQVADMRHQLLRANDDLRDTLHQQKLTSAASLIRRWRQGTIIPTFHAWRQITRDNRAHRRVVLERTMDRLTNGEVWRAWRQWQAYVEQDKLHAMRDALHSQKRRAGEAIIRRWRQGTLIPAFKEWRHVAHTNRQHRREVLERTCTRLTNGVVWRAWRTWTAFVEEEKVNDLQQQMASGKKAARLAIIKRWRLSSLSPVFVAWRTWATHSRAHKRDVLTRTLVRLEQSSVWRAWRQWRAYAHDAQVGELQHRLHSQLEVANRGRIRAMIQRWSVQSLAPKFHAWREYAHRQRSHKADVLGRMLRRMENNQVWRAWRTWQAYIEHDKVMALRGTMKHQSKTAVDTIVRRWRLGSMQPVFVTWRSYARDRRAHKRDLLGRMLVRLQSSAVWRAWRTWKMFIEDDKIRRLRGGLEAEKRKRITLMIKRWHNQTLIPCFNEWRKYARGAKQHKTELLGRTFLRLENSVLWRAWRTWLHYVEDAKVSAFKRENDRLRAISSSAIIKRWRFGSMQPAFHAWRTWTQQHRGHKRAVMERTLSRMSSSHIWRAWRTWKYYVANTEKHAARASTNALQKQVEQLRRIAQAHIIRRWRLGALVPAFNAWRATIAERRQRRNAVMSRTLTRMISSKLFGAWRQWRTYATMKTVVKRHKAERGQAMISRWRTRTLVPMFLRWRDIARETKQRKNQLLLRMLNRMVSSKQWSAWRTWQKYVEDSKVAALRDSLANQKNQHGAALIRRWRMRAMVPAFNNWRSYAAQRRAHKRELLGRTLLRLEQSSVWRAWRQWQSVVEEEQVDDMKRRLAKGGSMMMRTKASGISAIKRWRAGIRRIAFEQWRRAIIIGRQRKHDLLERTWRRLSASTLWRAWRIWKEYTENCKVHELRARFNDQTIILRRTIVDQKKKTQIAFIKRWRMMSLVPAFETWRSHVTMKRHAKRDLLERTVRRMNNSGTWQAWRLWRMYVEHDKIAAMRRLVTTQSRGRITSMITNWRQRTIVPMFTQWRMYVRQRKGMKRTILDTTMRRLTHQQLWCAWRLWKSYTTNAQTTAMRESLNKLKNRTATASIALWRNTSLSSTFQAWRRTTQRSNRRHRLLSRVMERLSHGLVRQALYRWRTDILRTQLAHANLSLRFARAQGDRRAGLLGMFHTWRAKMLQARLSYTLTAAEASAAREQSLANTIDTYSRELRELKARIAADEAQVADLTSRNSALRSDVESKQRKAHTTDQLLRQKNQARAGFFRANILLSRAFRRLLEHAQEQKTKRKAISRLLLGGAWRGLRHALYTWRIMAEAERSNEVERALAASRAQVESLLSRTAVLDSQVATMSGSSGREATLIRDAELLNKKIDLLVAEVKERGHHIQFLIEENAKLSSLYQATGRPLPETRAITLRPMDDSLFARGASTPRASSPMRLVAPTTPAAIAATAGSSSSSSSIGGRSPSTMMNGLTPPAASSSSILIRTPPPASGPQLANEREFWPSVARVARSLANGTPQ